MAIHTYAHIPVHTCTHTHMYTNTQKITILKILVALVPIIKLLKAETEISQAHIFR